MQDTTPATFPVKLQILIPLRDVTNTIAYSVECMLECLGADKQAATWQDVRCNLTQQQYDALQDDEQKNVLIKLMRSQYGVTVYDIACVVRVDVLQ